MPLLSGDFSQFISDPESPSPTISCVLTLLSHKEPVPCKGRTEHSRAIVGCKGNLLISLLLRVGGKATPKQSVVSHSNGTIRTRACHSALRSGEEIKQNIKKMKN